MRIETTENSIKLIEYRKEEGVWAVRWDFQPKLDSEGNETGVNWYEEEVYKWIPSIEDIQRSIVEWYNKQTDALIKHGFEWKGIKVLLTDENKFNFSMFAVEAERREKEIAEWDIENPDMSGKEYVSKEGVNNEGNVFVFQEPTGRPKSRLPITFKLGEGNGVDSFYTFATIKELFEFTAASTDHLQESYGVGWYKIATFDWAPYVQALGEL